MLDHNLKGYPDPDIYVYIAKIRGYYFKHRPQDTLYY